jgi:hypothetical protein
MLQQADLEAAIDAYEETTRLAIEASRSITLPQPRIIRFRTSELDEIAVEELLKKVPVLPHGEKTKKKRGFLYVFRTAEQCAVARADILGAMVGAKKLQKEKVKNLPALNTEALDGCTLYVGRSWTPGSRIGGHLKADLESGTYAMHLAAWAEKLDLEVELVIYEFRGIADRTLQVLEDGFWDLLRPLFGRRGEK